jgi:hypothetical protein
MTAAIASLGVVLWRLAPDGTVRHVSDTQARLLPFLVVPDPVGVSMCATLVPEDGAVFEQAVLRDGQNTTASFCHATHDGRGLRVTASVLRTFHPHTHALEEIILVARLAPAAVPTSAATPTEGMPGDYGHVPGSSPSPRLGAASPRVAAVEADLHRLHTLASYHADVLFQLHPVDLTVTARTAGDGDSPRLFALGQPLLAVVHPHDRVRLVRTVSTLCVPIPSALVTVRLRVPAMVPGEGAEDEDDNNNNNAGGGSSTNSSSARGGSGRWAPWQLSLRGLFAGDGSGMLSAVNGVARRQPASPIVSPHSGSRTGERRAGERARPAGSPRSQSPLAAAANAFTSASARESRGGLPRTASLPVRGTGRTGLMAAAGARPPPITQPDLAALAFQSPCFSDESLYARRMGALGLDDDENEDGSVDLDRRLPTLQIDPPPPDGNHGFGLDMDTLGQGDDGLVRADTWHAAPTGRWAYGAASDAAEPGAAGAHEENPFAWLRASDLVTDPLAPWPDLHALPSPI